MRIKVTSSPNMLPDMAFPDFVRGGGGNKYEKESLPCNLKLELGIRSLKQ